MFDDLLSPMHVIVLLLVTLLIFGPKRLPEIGSGLGKAIRDFKDTINGVSKPADISPMPATVPAKRRDITSEDSQKAVNPDQ